MVGYQHGFSTPFRGLAVAAGLIAVPASNYTVLRLALVVRAGTGTGTGTVEVAGLAGERACGQGPGLAEGKAHDGMGMPCGELSPILEAAKSTAPVTPRPSPSSWNRRGICARASEPPRFTAVRNSSAAS